jgi:hypothetical protein
MKKILPYLVFINCKNENPDDKNPTFIPDTNENPDIGDKNKRKDNRNQNYIGNEEIVDRIAKIYNLEKNQITKEKLKEIQKLKFEYQKENQKEIIEIILTSLFFKEEKMKRIKKEAETKKIIVNIPNRLYLDQRVIEKKTYSDLDPIIFENFSNKNEKIILLEESPKFGNISYNSCITTIENIQKLYKGEITSLEFHKKAKFFDEDGNICSFIEKKFSKKETEQGYYRIEIDDDDIFLDDKAKKYIEEYIKENQDKKFIFDYRSSSKNSPYGRNMYEKNFREEFKKYKNCFFRKIDFFDKTIFINKVFSIYSTEYFLFCLLEILEENILYFEYTYDISENEKIEEGTIISVKDFFEKLKQGKKKIKYSCSGQEKKEIEESDIYKKYLDCFELTSE